MSPIKPHRSPVQRNAASAPAPEFKPELAATLEKPWRDILAPYQNPSLLRSLLEIALSAGPLALFWTVAWIALANGLWWLAALLTIPAAAFVVRLFMIQHDCSHAAFFKSRAANDWAGRIFGVITLTPFACWRKSHAIHHATSGHLDRRGLGAINTLTIDEYRALSFWRRVGYRLYRHPLILFGLGPVYVFLLEQRLPAGFMREGWWPWISAMGTNLAAAAFLIAIGLLGGWQGLLLIHLPTMAIAAGIGMWLFFIQHQFEGTYWARRDEWNYSDAALRGSSHYDLPQPFRWMTANIGIHHVHHLSSRIPFYRLSAVLRDHPELRAVSRVGFWQSLGVIGLSLWDESRRRLVSFREAHAAR
jgi:omega-6 fatty acid desaturase (delta-12 desaturase)